MGAPPADDHQIDPDVYRRRWWTLGVLCTSLLIIMVANTSLNVALPKLMQSLRASNTDVQWMVEAYSLVFAGALFTMGNLGDRYGRKGILQLGLLLFGAATVFATFFAETTAHLIASRVVMGLAAAMVMPATLSIITNVFPREERAKAVAMWAGISGAGTAFGPLISGWVIERYDWSVVFGINLPLIAAALVAGYFFVPRLATHRTPLDIPGAFLSAAGLGLLCYSLIEAPNYGWVSGHTLGIGAASLVILGLFMAWELRATSPMLDVRLFRIGAFGVSSLTLTMVFFALMGMFFSISQLMQLVYGYGAFEASLRMAPISVAIMISAPRSASLAAKYGKSRIVAIGLWMIAAGVGLLASNGVVANYPVLLAGLFTMALGMGLAMSPTTDLLMSAVPREKAGMGSAMNDTTRELGASLGVAVFGSLLASRYADSIAPALTGLPAEAREAATASLGQATYVSEQIGEAGAPVLAAAKEAYVSGFRFSLIVGAVVVALAGVLAIRFLPDQAHDIPTTPDGADGIPQDVPNAVAVTDEDLDAELELLTLQQDQRADPTR